MAKVRATKEGYYDHRIIRVGEVLDVREVDKEGYYVDGKGKRKLFPVLDINGQPRVDSKGPVLAERKCRWVAHVGSDAGRPLDPKEVAKVISGKSPGHAGSAAEGGLEAIE